MKPGWLTSKEYKEYLAQKFNLQQVRDLKTKDKNKEYSEIKKVQRMMSKRCIQLDEKLIKLTEYKQLKNFDHKNVLRTQSKMERREKRDNDVKNQMYQTYGNQLRNQLKTREEVRKEPDTEKEQYRKQIEKNHLKVYYDLKDNFDSKIQQMRQEGLNEKYINSFKSKYQKYL